MSRQRPSNSVEELNTKTSHCHWKAIQRQRWGRGERVLAPQTGHDSKQTKTTTSVV